MTIICVKQKGTKNKVIINTGLAPDEHFDDIICATMAAMDVGASLKLNNQGVGALSKIFLDCFVRKEKLREHLKGNYEVIPQDQLSLSEIHDMVRPDDISIDSFKQ